MKRILRLTMAALLLGSFSANAQYLFSGGKGTSDDPFQIKTAEDLDHVRDYLDNDQVNFKVMNDIDLTEFIGEGDWEPMVSTYPGGFEGTFDGGNFTIRGLFNDSGNDGLGLFGRVNTPGVVKNVIIDGADIEGRNWCGILVSTNGNGDKQGGTIQNCHVYNSYLSGAASLGIIVGENTGSIIDCSSVYNTVEASGNNAGGITGNSNNGAYYVMENCFSIATISGNETLGGICGLFGFPKGLNNEPSMVNCAAYGYINGKQFCGGLFGYNGNPNSLIDNNYANMDVTSCQAGGLVGAPLGGVLTNSYATGDVNALVAEGDDWSGGIAAAAYGGIDGVYYSGTISGNAKMQGAICGRNYWAPFYIKNAFWKTGSSTQAMGQGAANMDLYQITELSEADMMSLSNFTFDKSKWQIQEGKTTPYFSNQTAPLTIDECTVDGASGTYTGDVKNLYFYNSNGAIPYASVTIDGGKWSVVWEKGMLSEGNTVVALCKEDGKMPSQAIKAKATMGSVGEVTASANVEVVAGNGFIRINSDSDAAYAVFNVAGAALMQGNLVAGESVVSTESLQGGVYVVVVNTENGVVSRKVVL